MTLLQPRNTRWINDKESRLAQARIAEDAGEADQDTEADSYGYAPRLDPSYQFHDSSQTLPWTQISRCRPSGLAFFVDALYVPALIINMLSAAN
jgi:hypothetical protein